MERKLRPHGAPVTAVRYSAHGHVILSAGKNGLLAVSNPDNGNTLRVLNDHKGAQITSLQCVAKQDGEDPPPSLAAFCPTDPGLVVYTGYGVEKEISFYSLARKRHLQDSQTVPPPPRITENTAIIAGVVAALVVLVALTLLAVYYINTHPTVAPPFYLMQGRTNNYWPSMKFRNQGCHSTYAEVELGVHEKDGFIEAEQCC
ncbi:hypothetical protein NHX12_017351 [Muraenolepis orangiensis]|uniref:WDR90 4th beta-propeller domain-containing protein n=1 Tax=Muraenolepis orangiensis TaxID=630683 RepID=A0A9Q0EY41_9TELE|nr:hypothetical protein NHX12_017351 [Muraenolepis orangiensis]